MSAQVFVSAHNLPKVTLHGFCHSLASSKASKVAEVQFYRLWAQWSLIKYAFYENMSCQFVKWGWSSNLGSVTLFECWFTMKPLSDISQTLRIFLSHWLSLKIVETLLGRDTVGPDSVLLRCHMVAKSGWTLWQAYIQHVIILNRPGVAGAVLQTPLSLIH